jgi:hypothetical protein
LSNQVLENNSTSLILSSTFFHLSTIIGFIQASAKTKAQNNQAGQLPIIIGGFFGLLLTFLIS